MLTKIELDNWVKFLRDNPEKQGSGFLAKADLSQMCCLGALCRTLEIPSTVEGNQFLLFDGDGGVLPNSARIRSGLSAAGAFSDVGMPSLNGHLTLISANDSEEVTWAEIADHLEKYYPYECKVA